MGVETRSWEEVRRHFPITEEAVYLDAAAVGPMPDFLRDSHLRAFEERLGRRAPGEFLESRERARGALARYMAVAPDDIVYLGNTTDAINTVAGSIAWKPGDEVVVHDQDFPSNLIPWIRLRERGVVVRAAQSEHGRLSIEAVERELSERTRLVALSHVFYHSGFRMDLAELGRRLHQRNIYLSVDGIQALGLARPDLEHVDFYMGAIYKGLCGPFGLSILYVDPRAADTLVPEHVGYASLDSDGIPWEGSMPYRTGSQRFQAASVNYPALHALADMMEFLEALTFERVTERILDLSGAAMDGLGRVAGVDIVTPPDRDRRLGIAAFRVGDLPSDVVAAELAGQGIRVAARAGNVRASFHIYNNDEDVARLVGAVADLARGRMA
jgi:cysteine desulfurase/selenocysteine lyase